MNDIWEEEIQTFLNSRKFPVCDKVFKPTTGSSVRYINMDTFHLYNNTTCLWK